MDTNPNGNNPITFRPSSFTLNGKETKTSSLTTETCENSSTSPYIVIASVEGVPGGSGDEMVTGPFNVQVCISSTINCPGNITVNTGTVI